MSGAGTSAAGVQVAGYGAVDTAIAPQQVILIDASDGSLQNARRIDPVTKRYVYNSKGQVEGMRGVQQLVLMRANTLLNSSAVRNLGMPNPTGVIGPDILRRLSNEITNAMKDLVDAKLIQVVDVNIIRTPGANSFQRFFVWRDLTDTPQGVEQKTAF